MPLIEGETWFNVFKPLPCPEPSELAANPMIAPTNTAAKEPSNAPPNKDPIALKTPTRPPTGVKIDKLNMKKNSSFNYVIITLI